MMITPKLTRKKEIMKMENQWGTTGPSATKWKKNKNPIQFFYQNGLKGYQEQKMNDRVKLESGGYLLNRT